MKKATNFRLSNQTTRTLSLLEKKMHLSKTTIVEKAIQFYAKKELASQHPLLKFSGILDDDEADSMLESIREHKHNKDTEIEL